MGCMPAPHRRLRAAGGRKRRCRSHHLRIWRSGGVGTYDEALQRVSHSDAIGASQESHGSNAGALALLVAAKTWRRPAPRRQAILVSEVRQEGEVGTSDRGRSNATRSFAGSSNAHATRWPLGAGHGRNSHEPRGCSCWEILVSRRDGLARWRRGASAAIAREPVERDESTGWTHGQQLESVRGAERDGLARWRRGASAAIAREPVERDESTVGLMDGSWSRLWSRARRTRPLASWRLSLRKWVTSWTTWTAPAQSLERKLTWHLRSNAQESP